MRKILVVAALLFGLESGSIWTPPNAVAQAPPKQAREDFRQTMINKPLPGKGCFTAHYPTPNWEPASCGTAPRYPNPIARGARMASVGNGNDYFLQETGNINSATGSFDNVTGISDDYSEAGYIGGVPPLWYNTYSIQLNTNTFTTTVCGGQPSCVGWQQFVFSQSECQGPCIFIQNWLLRHGNPCPPGGWLYYSDPVSSSASGCYMNSASSTVSPKPPLAELSELKLSGVVSGGTDIVMLATANGDVQALAQDSTLNLAQGWTGSEFNLVGDCCGAGAYFLNPATSLTVRLTALNGTTNPPTYTMFFSGATGEFNNLTLGSAPSVVGGTSPAIVFQESGGGSRPDGVILGDPHLNNIYGVHYDFQGTGDFLMLRADPDLEVQARLAPWVDPRASVTTALGVRMGETHVAVCLNGLEVNGVPSSVDDGKQLKLDDGVVVTRQNNTYVISRITGDQVQAKLQGRWMDITTKLGAAHPLRVGGLLGGDSDLRLLMQDGSALTQPISWNTWKSYGDSWRVADADSLLCHGSAVPPGFPEKRVTFEDLSGPEREHASAVCERAKVPHGPLFYDCVLDVALTKQDSAANAFANHPPVKTVISPLPPP